MKSINNTYKERCSKLSVVWWAYVVIALLTVQYSFAQQSTRQEVKNIKDANAYLYDASEAMQEDNFAQGEANYRNAIALNPEDKTGKYNLGNAYYQAEMNDAAMMRYIQAAKIATTKKAKHKAYHNLGNTFMNAKQYKEAVEAFKNALRNNPQDEETRYNYALAKELLENEQNQGGGEDEKDKEQEKQEEKEEEKEKENNEENKEGDEGDEKEDKEDGKEKEDENKGDEEEDKGKPNEPNKEQEKQPKKQQQQPGKLSPQQVKNLLEAMNNEEKKVQDKINVKKQKGAKVKSNKDW